MKLVYSKQKTKYLIHEYWEHKLAQQYNILSEFDNGYHFLKKKEDGWYIGVHPGCRVDGVTSWVDSGFLFKASVGHDVLCWLIEEGIIDESDNDKIDREFRLMILEFNKNYPIWKGGNFVRELRARLAEKGTNLANSYKDEQPKLYVIE